MWPSTSVTRQPPHLLRPRGRRLLAGGGPASWSIRRAADVVDVGCGGGTYTRAWHDWVPRPSSASTPARPILDAARESHGDLPGVSFRLGDAAATGLPAGCADVVFERALIHHVPDLGAVAAEAFRHPPARRRPADPGPHPGRRRAARLGRSPPGLALRPLPAAARRRERPPPHRGRRLRLSSAPASATSPPRPLEEVRRRYADREDYLAEIAARTGRSILHELDDAELGRLVEGLRERFRTDRWSSGTAGRSGGPSAVVRTADARQYGRAVYVPRFNALDDGDEIPRLVTRVGSVAAVTVAARTGTRRDTAAGGLGRGPAGPAHGAGQRALAVDRARGRRRSPW